MSAQGPAALLGMSRLLGYLPVVALVTACAKYEPPGYIIHITADDLGYGELGSYGQRLIRTPNLDELARQGLRLRNYYAGSSLCNPSRYALMVGKHAGTTEIIHNGENTLPEGEFTLARLMKAGGYKTAAFGKWSLGVPSSTGAPLKQGFDYFFGYTDQLSAHNYYPARLHDGTRFHRIAANKLSDQRNVSSERVIYAPELIQQRALEFIEAHLEAPFYLQLDYNLPHVNNELHEATGNGFEHPVTSRYSAETWTDDQKSYAELVSLFDDYVGDVVNKLEQLGIANSTLLIVTSDNGPTGVRGRESRQLFAATGGLRGMKGMLFEGGIRVPMIAWWPGTIDAGETSDELATFWDLMPTLAELIEQPEPASDGVSFARVLLRNQKMPQNRPLYWEVRDRKALRLGDWKWVHHPMRDKPSDYLFNLAQDPGEQNNLAEAHPEIINRLETVAEQMRAARHGRPFLEHTSD